MLTISGMGLPPSSMLAPMSSGSPLPSCTAAGCTGNLFCYENGVCECTLPDGQKIECQRELSAVSHFASNIAATALRVGVQPGAPSAPPMPAPPASPQYVCSDGMTIVSSPSMCPAVAVIPQPTGSGGSPGIPPSNTPTSYTCSDGMTVVTDPSMCPAAMAAMAAASNAAATSGGLAPVSPAVFTCSDGVTVVSSPSQCPVAAASPAAGSSTGMMVTPTATPPSTGMLPAIPAIMPPGMYTPTILGIDQSTFLWGAALVAIGVGGFFFYRSRTKRAA